MCANEVELLQLDEAETQKKEYQYSPPPNPPAIIQVFREKNKDTPESRLVDIYYKFIDKIRDSKLDISQRIMYCQMSLPLIESVIKNTVESYGQFDLKSIPVIEKLVTHCAKKGIKGQLLNIRDIVNYFPELAPWRKKVEKALNKVK